MLPRRRPDSAAQDAYNVDPEADAAFASKPPLAKSSSISKVLLQYSSVTLLKRRFMTFSLQAAMLTVCKAIIKKLIACVWREAYISTVV